MLHTSRHWYFMKISCKNLIWCQVGVGDITGISVYCDSVKKQFIPRYVFCNTSISAISGNHRLFPLTALKEKAPVMFS